MAVPKKRTGHSAQGKRRANWKATKPETTTCKNCGATVLTHTVCTACGYYKGKPVSKKAALPAVEAKPEKETKAAEVKEEKSAKKTSTKAKKEEVVEEVKEEVKEEKTSEE